MDSQYDEKEKYLIIYSAMSQQWSSVDLVRLKMDHLATLRKLFEFNLKGNTIL